MIDLKMYKNEKQTKEALKIVNGFAEARKMYEEVKQIAQCDGENYTPDQKLEAQQLTKDGFIEFVSIIMKLRN